MQKESSSQREELLILAINLGRSTELLKSHPPPMIFLYM